MLRSLILLVLLPVLVHGQQDQKVLMRSEKGEITFVSDAPLERITATNRKFSSVVDLRDRSFALQLSVIGFTGFNSPMQQEHFNENYLETPIHPQATFKGKIIENIDLTVPGTHTVRAKGVLNIHGVSRERIITCQIVVATDGVRVTSEFNVTLADHDIRVPGVVRQKIAPVVQVKVDILYRRPN